MSNDCVPSFANLLSREEIIRRLLENWTVERLTEEIPVEDALGRIPAADVFSCLTLPLVRASAGDGVAVSSARFADGLPDTSQWTEGEDFVRADTGDDFSDAFDAVIMIEDVELEPEGRLRITGSPRVTPGMNIRGAGSAVRAGELLARAFLPLRPRDLAVLQMGGAEIIQVIKKPVVAFIPTGSELIAPGTPLSRGKNIDINSLLVRETLKGLGAEPLCFPIIKDRPQDLEKALDEALERADIVIINGGSSKGEEDCNATLLHQRGQVLCHGAQAVPGKPLCAAFIDGKPVINLPGPFLATYHGLEWCVNAAVSHYLNQPRKRRRTVKATLTRELRGSDTVSMLMMVDVTRKAGNDGFYARPFSMREERGARCAAANGQYMTKLGEYLSAGGEIEVELLRGVEYIPMEEE